MGSGLEASLFIVSSSEEGGHGGRGSFQGPTKNLFVNFPGGSGGKESVCSAGDLGLISGLGRSPGEGNGNPLQYSCLENPMDGGTWQATIHAVARVGHNLRTKPPSPPPYRHPES